MKMILVSLASIFFLSACKTTNVSYDEIACGGRFNNAIWLNGFSDGTYVNGFDDVLEIKRSNKVGEYQYSVSTENDFTRTFRICQVNRTLYVEMKNDSFYPKGDLTLYGVSFSNDKKSFRLNALKVNEKKLKSFRISYTKYYVNLDSDRIELFIIKDHTDTPLENLAKFLSFENQDPDEVKNNTYRLR